MPKYVILFSVTSDALSRFIDRPEDRRGPVNAIAQAVGGKLEREPSRPARRTARPALPEVPLLLDERTASVRVIGRLARK